MTKKSSGESLEEKPIESITPAPATISVEEFCKKLSVTDRRVELIGGFFHWAEKVKKVTKAKEKKFTELFGEFVKMPV